MSSTTSTSGASQAGVATKQQENAPSSSSPNTMAKNNKGPANRPIQPQGSQAGSSSSGMFDLSMSSMSGMSLGSLGSFGSLVGMDSSKQMPPMGDQSTQGPSDNGRVGGAPQPSSAGGRPQQQQRGGPTGGQGQSQARPGQGASPRGSMPSNGQGQAPLAPLQPHPGASGSSSGPSGQAGGPSQPMSQPNQQQAPGSPSSTSTAVVPASPGSQGSDRRVINPVTVPNGQNFVDITEYLNMPQSEAAKKLSIPPSTLSKRWKEAVRNRKWPWRVVCKLDKEIMTLLHNVPQGAPIPEEIEGRLGYLMRKRQDELKPVVIRL